MSAGLADPSRKGARDVLRALFAEAKRRMWRRRRRRLASVAALLVAGGILVLLTGGNGGGGGPAGSAGAQRIHAQLAARLQVVEAEAHGELSPLGSTPSLSQLMANFAVLRRPQSAADRSWHPNCSCAGAADQLTRLTRFVLRLPHGYRVFLDVERFIAGGQLNTPAGSYMMNLDFVDRYGNTDSTSFGANTQYTVQPLSTSRPGPPTAADSGGAGLASVVPDGVTKVSWRFGCPRGSRLPAGARAGSSTRVVAPVVNNVAATWVPKALPADCPGAMKVVWWGGHGQAFSSSGGFGNLEAPPFVKGRLGHGTERLLTSTSVGTARIGSSSAGALATLGRQFGSPADSNVLVHGCAGVRETVWTSPAVADPLIAFTDHGRFVGYQYGDEGGGSNDPGRGPGAVLATSGGLTLGSEIRALRAAYPHGYASASSTFVGYWSVSSAGSRFYGSATPDRYPAHAVAPGDRISTIGAGAFPTCSTVARQTRGPVLVAPGPHASPQTRARYYMLRADLQARRAGSCTVPAATAAKPDEGTPSQALLAKLAVLRRAPGARDSLPRSLRGSAPPGTFVRYVRLARTVGGISYYVVPATSPSRFPPALSGRCIAAISAALHAEERRIPSGVRARTLALTGRLLARSRQMLIRGAGNGVCLLFAGHRESGDTCGANAADVSRWGLTSNIAQLAGIVPDGVAAVTVHVPAYQGQPAITAHAKVVNNVFATAINESFGNRRRATIVWLTASGRVVRTVPAQVTGVGDSSGCGGCGA